MAKAAGKRQLPAPKDTAPRFYSTHPESDNIKALLLASSCIFSLFLEDFLMAGKLSYEALEQRNKELEIAEAERKQAEETLLQNVSAAVVVHGSDTRIVQCNQAAQDLLGLTEDQILGKKSSDPDWNFLCEDGSVMPVEEYPITQVLKNRKPLKNYIAGIRRTDKLETTWVFISAIPEFDEKDSVSQVVVTFMDITDRKQAEEALQESEEKYRKLFEHAGFAISLIDVETNERLEFNQEAHNPLGYTSAEFKNKALLSTDAEKSKKRIISHHKEIVEKGPELFEAKQKTKNGKTLDVLISAVPIKLGGRWLINNISANITDRKQAEETLRESEAEKTAILDGITTGIRFVNENMEILWVNKAAADSANESKSPEDMIGHKCFQFWGDDPKKLCDGCPVMKTFKTNKAEEIVRHPAVVLKKLNPLRMMS